MVGFLSGLRKPRGENYDLWRLVDARFVRDGEAGPQAPIQLICDIDKTYLETEFESLVKIARIAFFEEAGDKVTVHGASEVLLAARWGDMGQTTSEAGYPRALHFVSSSPPQLRRVLEEKLTMDGLDWTSDTFKNQAYNIRKGRFDQLRQQIAYKSAAILNLVARSRDGCDFYLIGDNAESDALIYLGVKLLLEGRLSLKAYEAYLCQAGVERKVASDLIARFPKLPRARVRAVLIRNLANYQFHAAPPLTDGVMLFSNFFEVALLLMLAGVVDAACLWPLVRRFHNRYGLGLAEIAALLQAAQDSASADSSLSHALQACLARLAQVVTVDLTAVARRPPLRANMAEPAGAPSSEEDILEQVRLWVQTIERARGDEGN